MTKTKGYLPGPKNKSQKQHTKSKNPNIPKNDQGGPGRRPFARKNHIWGVQKGGSVSGKAEPYPVSRCEVSKEGADKGPII